MKKQGLLFVFLFLLSCASTFLEDTQAVMEISSKVSYNTETNGVLLQWNKQDDAVSYTVLRGTEPEKLEIILSNFIDAVWLDESALPGVKYHYVVKSYNVFKNQIGQTPIQEGLRAYLSSEYVKMPHAFKVSQDAFVDKVRVQWMGQDGVRYRIYRKNITDEAGEPDPKSPRTERLAPAPKPDGLECMIEVFGNEFMDTEVEPDSVYLYKIASVSQDEKGNIIEKFTTIVQGSTAYAPRDMQAVSRELDVISLSWKKDPDATYYQLYRATSEDGEYELIAPFVHNNSYTDYALPTLEGSVINGEWKYPTYYYKTTIVKNAQVSQFSKTVSAYAINSKDMKKAPEIKLTVDKSNYPYVINLRWEPVEEYDIPYHVVKITEDGKETILTKFHNRLCIDLLNEPFGTQVEYVVRGINVNAGNLLGFPGKIRYASLTPSPPKMLYASESERILVTNMIATNIPMITDIHFNGRGTAVGNITRIWKVTSEAGYVDLKWEPLKNDESIAYYNVYRAPSVPNEKYIKPYYDKYGNLVIDKVNPEFVPGEYKLVASNLTELEIKDSAFTPEEYKGLPLYAFRMKYPDYFYEVTAVFSGNESGFSNNPKIGSAYNPHDILPAPDYLTVPFHYAKNTGWWNWAIPKPVPDSPKGADKLIGAKSGANFLWVTWGEVEGAESYRFRHSRNAADTPDGKGWYNHGFVKDTKYWMNNEITKSSYTHLYQLSDSWPTSYLPNKVGFEVGAVNPHANGLVGDILGVHFAEPAKNPF